MSESTAYAGPWSSLASSLTPWIFDVIQSMGYSKMTPVQAATIPLFMQNKDVVVEAVTGSGKTLAFVVPILERLVRRRSTLRTNEIGALVISPTRELATQIHSVFSLFLSTQPCPPPRGEPTATDTPISAHPPPLLLVSSKESSPGQDIQRFLATGADIVIGTPGRVEEFLTGRGKTVVSVKEFEVLVLDEADRLLDLGFQNTLTRVITHLPKQRRTGLFSATMTDADALSELVRVGLRNPARVVVKVQSKMSLKRASNGKPGKGEVIEERRIPAGLHNFYVSCRSSEKLVQLVRVIEHQASSQQASYFIVYFATCACVDYFYRVLPKLLVANSKLFSLHGHLLPAARTRALSAFSSSLATPTSPSILLATDVAARGLDLPHVDVVIQFDPPIDTKAFSHRCGRTARAGRSGRAYAFLVGRETEYIGARYRLETCQLIDDERAREDFLAVRKIPIRNHSAVQAGGVLAERGSSELESDDPAVPMFLSRIRETVLKDRALHDKVFGTVLGHTLRDAQGHASQAVKSFVSFVRAYSKHEASYIFRVKDLDLVGVATSFGLLRLPRMPELKDVDKSRWEDASVDWDSYAYVDKAQEAKRRASSSKPQVLKEVIETRAAKRKRNAAWSQQAASREQKEKRKLQRDRKRQWLKSRNATPSTATSVKLQSTKHSLGDEDDWDELAEEERLAKKVRKGTTQQAFDAEFGEM